MRSFKSILKAININHLLLRVKVSCFLFPTLLPDFLREFQKINYPILWDGHPARSLSLAPQDACTRLPMVYTQVLLAVFQSI